METREELNWEALEKQAKLEVKIRRTILRQQLIVLGNAMLVGYLFAVLVMCIYVVAMQFGGQILMKEWGRLLWGAEAAEHIPWLSLVAYTAFKIGAALLLLCPGLGLRICGAIMRA